MMVATDIAFFVGVALYVVAAAVAAAYLHRPDEGFLSMAQRLVLMGAGLLLATLVLRAVQWDRLPLTNVADSLNLFVVMTTVVMTLVARQERMRPLLSFYLPPVALIALLNAAVGHGFLHGEPRELRGAFLTVHVGLAFLAYALFFVASITSVGYVFQANRLKHRRTTGLFQRLPSLERLDKVLFRLVGAGYVLFAITVVLGFFWAYLDRDILGPHWYLAPKVLLALVMASFFSIAFHSRRLGRLRGPKLAYFVCIGFAVLLTVNLALGLTQLSNYNFWGRSA